MRIASRVTGISGIAANAPATVPLPVNRRYHTIKLFTTLAGVAALASSVVTEIKAKVNEKTIWEVSVAELLKHNALIGLPDPDGVLSLHFSRPDLADIINEEATAWDMFGEASFRLEVKMANNATASFEAFSYYDQIPNLAADGRTPAKVVLRLKSLTETFSAGQKDWTTLPKDRPILRILLDAAGTIPHVDVNADDFMVYEASAAVNASMLADYGINAAQFKYPLVFNFTNRINDGLMVTRSLNVRVTSGASQNISALMETLSFNFQA